MIKFINIVPRKSKTGFTLVEMVIGVVILSLFAIGILASLAAAGNKMAQNARKAEMHSEATQLMDAVIAIVSNGDYSTKANVNDVMEAVWEVLDVNVCNGTLADTDGEEENIDLEMVPVEYDDGTLRAWKIKLTYKKELTVTGYSSNTKGVFDIDNESDEVVASSESE